MENTRESVENLRKTLKTTTQNVQGTFSLPNEKEETALINKLQEPDLILYHCSLVLESTSRMDVIVKSAVNKTERITEGNILCNEQDLNKIQKIKKDSYDMISNLQKRFPVTMEGTKKILNDFQNYIQKITNKTEEIIYKKLEGLNKQLIDVKGKLKEAADAVDRKILDSIKPNLKKVFDFIFTRFVHSVQSSKKTDEKKTSNFNYFFRIKLIGDIRNCMWGSDAVEEESDSSCCVDLVGIISNAMKQFLEAAGDVLDELPADCCKCFFQVLCCLCQDGCEGGCS